MVEAQLRVIYGDTDQMGVVYYANYFRYFELARSELIRQKGGSYREIEASGVLLPVVEAACSYQAFARYDDLLSIFTRISSMRRASLTFSYEIRRKGEDRVLCTGKTVHASIGKDGRPCRMPEAITRLAQGEPLDATDLGAADSKEP
ncbi:MAG: acyl-CoA thioesterase [Myxococcaceae bacterium]